MSISPWFVLTIASILGPRAEGVVIWEETQVKDKILVGVVLGLIVGVAITVHYHNIAWIYDYKPLFWHNKLMQCCLPLDVIEQCDVYYYGKDGFVSSSEKGGWAVYFTYGCRRHRAGHYQISVIAWNNMDMIEESPLLSGDFESVAAGNRHCWIRVKYEDYPFFLNEAKLRARGQFTELQEDESEMETDEFLAPLPEIEATNVTESIP